MSHARPRLSAIVPTLDEAAGIGALVQALLQGCDEVVVSDGGSADGTVALARAAGARVVQGARGRGPQLARGVQHSEGELLWLVHADSVLQVGAALAVRAAARRARWGCCPVRIDSADPRLRMTARLMNRRAAQNGGCTGDMGIWMWRDALEEVGGIPSLPAFEDLVLTDRLRTRSPGGLAPTWMQTSDRRWTAQGINRQIVRLLALRLAYRLGVDPGRLAPAHPPRPA